MLRNKKENMLVAGKTLSVDLRSSSYSRPTLLRKVGCLTAWSLWLCWCVRSNGHDAPGRPPVVVRLTLGTVILIRRYRFCPWSLRSACVLLPVMWEVDARTNCLCRVHPLGVSRQPHSTDIVALCCRLSRHHPGHLSLAIGLG